MKLASTIARYVLALLFTVFGLNGFLQFIPMAPMPALAGRFFEVLMASHYMVLVFVIQMICGLLFLVNRYIPLALTLIAPVIVNILLFHVTMNPEGIAPGVVATICWFLVFARFRPAFNGVFGHGIQQAAS